MPTYTDVLDQIEVPASPCKEAVEWAKGLNLDEDDAYRAYWLTQNPGGLAALEEGLTYNDIDPDRYRNHGTRFRDVHWRREATTDRIMDLIGALMGGPNYPLDVQAVEVEGAYVDSYYRNFVALYVNVGDPYLATVLFDTEEEEFYVGCWGDTLEAAENKLREENEDDDDDSWDDDEEEDEDF